MGLSSDPNNTSTYSERETQPTFNLREIVAAKVGSLLQDIIGLPSSFSRQYSGKNQWDVGINDIHGQDRERRSKTQLTGPVEEAREDDENAYEIPIKKSFHLESEKSHSDNSTPATVGGKQSEEEKYNVPKLISHFSWEVIYSGNHHSAEPDDKKDSLKIKENSNVNTLDGPMLMNLDHLPDNDFFGLKTNSFINSSYMPFSLSSIACGFFNEADRISRDSFNDTFGRNFGRTSIPNHMSIFKPQPLDSTLTGNAVISENSLKICDLDSSNPKQKFSREENQVLISPNKQMSAISNPFDSVFFDGSHTEMDLHNLFTNWFSSFNKDTKKYGMLYTNQAAQDNCDVKTLIPSEKINQQFDSSKKASRYDSEAKKVVSTFSSTVQHMGPDGRLYTSVKTCKTFGDGRNSTTTRDYMRNVDLRSHKEQ